MEFIISALGPKTSPNQEFVSPFMQTSWPVMLYNIINNIPVFFKSSPHLWFKVVEATFDENQAFTRSSRFRHCLEAKFQSINWRSLENCCAILLHDRCEKKTFAYAITDRQRYVSFTKITLSSDVPTALLHKMKSSFRRKRLTSAIYKLLRGIFVSFT